MRCEKWLRARVTSAEKLQPISPSGDNTWPKTTVICLCSGIYPGPAPRMCLCGLRGSCSAYYDIYPFSLPFSETPCLFRACIQPPGTLAVNAPFGDASERRINCAQPARRCVGGAWRLRRPCSPCALSGLGWTEPGGAMAGALTRRDARSRKTRHSCHGDHLIVSDSGLPSATCVMSFHGCKQDLQPLVIVGLHMTFFRREGGDPASYG